MARFFKVCVGVSALVAAGFVAVTQPDVEAQAAAVLSSKGDRLPVAAAAAGCEQQTWPYITGSCLIRENGEAAKVRYVTVERRPAPGTSVLIRMSAK